MAQYANNNDLGGGSSDPLEWLHNFWDSLTGNAPPVTTSNPYGQHAINTFTTTDAVELAYRAPRLFGGPFIYTPQVDPRIRISDGSTEAIIGRTTSQTLYQAPTIISITPGKVRMKNFLSIAGIGDGDSNSIIREIISADVNGISTDDMNRFYKKFDSQKYFYDFQSAWSEYANLLNLNARIMSIMCGIGDRYVAGTKTKYKEYNYINWQYRSDNAQNIGEAQAWTDVGGALSKVFTHFTDDLARNFAPANQYVHYYGGVSTDASDNVSTSTRESSIQSKFESSFDDTVKDIQFLVGDSLSDVAEGIKEDIGDIFGKSGLDSEQGGWKSLMESVNGYLKGAKLVFPQMVDDFTYEKSITCHCRFASPYGDPESIFIYCMLPLASVLAMTLPRQESNNQYKSPLLCRAYSQGYFNCELGVISSLRVERGGPDKFSWTAGGMPTEIEVQFDITPLYTQLMGTSAAKPAQFLHNDGLQEYLATICGADMKGDAISAKVNMFWTLAQTSLSDLPQGFLNKIRDSALFNAFYNWQNIQ